MITYQSVTARCHHWDPARADLAARLALIAVLAQLHLLQSKLALIPLAR